MRHKDTSSNRIRNLLAALASTALAFGLVWFAAPHDGYIYKLFFERSIIQYLTMFFFWLAIWSLLSQHRRMIEERDAEAAVRDVVENFWSSQKTAALTWSEVPRVRDAIEKGTGGKFQRSQVLRRVLHGLERLHKTQSTAETREYFNTASDLSAADSDSSFSMIGYMVWLLPTLGFIGTVLGIGLGIAGFAEIIRKSQNFDQIRDALPTVTQQLGTAFDTTLLALLLSVVVVLYSSWLRKRVEDVLTSIDKLCHDGVLPLFREYSHATHELIDAIQASSTQVVNSANANRVVLAGLLQNLVAGQQDTNQQLQRTQEDVKALRQQSSQANDRMETTHVELVRLREEVAGLRAAIGARAASAGRTEAV